MFDKRILGLIPKSIYCPLCGDWHDWNGKSLQTYDRDNPYVYECNGTSLKLRFFENYIDIFSEYQICYRIHQRIAETIYFEDFLCDKKDCVIKFSTILSTDEVICTSECENCMECNLPFIGDNRSVDDDEDELKLEFRIEFERTEFHRYVDAERKERQQKSCSSTQPSGKARTSKENNQPAKIAKEDTTMKNNIFGTNIEFGANKDENIASTLMGVAVKNGDRWMIYDKKKKEITDIGDLQLGNLPIFILPTTKLSEGDLIKDAGEYYFVSKVEAGKTQTLCVKSGEMKTVIPIKNVLGFSCYSKVIALSDSLDMGDDFDIEKLAIMSAMCNQNDTGNQMNQLLPLMLFKDKFNTGDDTMKLVLMSSMMNPTADGGQMNQLLPFMFLKDADGGNADTMKLMLMCSMMSNADANNNPMMTYLMIDKFMGKKDDVKDLKVAEESIDQKDGEES